jgi:hypothetical protein
MSVVRVKPGVQFDVIAPGGIRILAALEEGASLHNVDLEITSGTDFHALPDPHARGEAYDVSVQGLHVDDVVALWHWFVTTLGPLFTVLYECPTVPTDPKLRAISYIGVHATAPHFHLQVKNGVTYPPPAAAPAPTRTA